MRHRHGAYFIETCSNHPKKREAKKLRPAQARWEIQLSEITFELTLHKVPIVAEPGLSSLVN
jgi:hypothetical protein